MFMGIDFNHLSINFSILVFKITSIIPMNFDCVSNNILSCFSYCFQESPISAHCANFAKNGHVVAPQNLSCCYLKNLCNFAKCFVDISHEISQG